MMAGNNVQNQQKHRPIRSFVRRQGRMTQAQQQAIGTLWSNYGLALDDGMRDLDEVFGRSVPRTLEIGFGMGECLIEAAQGNPDQDFIGVDIYRPGIGKALMEIERRHINNIRLFNADVIDVLYCCIPDGSFDRMNIFFPDPWPKKRHHKRRLIQPAFIEVLRAKLKLGGRLSMATDWEGYAYHMLSVMGNSYGFINIAGAGHFAERSVRRPLTKFELRGKKLGHKVWDLVFVREV